MNQHASWTLGLLLGGQSRRMGRNKAFIELKPGISLLEWMIARCTGAADRADIPLLLSCGQTSQQLPVPDSLAAIPQVDDEFIAAGPLGGIESLLAHCRTDWLIVIPCDMPNLGRQHLEFLIAQVGADDSCARFEVPGQAQTFPLALRPRARPQIREALENGRYKVRLALAEIQGSYPPVPEAWPANLFANLNSQEDLQNYLDEN